MSSIVTIRSVDGIASASTLSSVDLPAPVPPDTRMLRFARTAMTRNSRISGDKVPMFSRSSLRSRRCPKRRIDNVGPSIVTGGSVALTRLPSARRKSAIGDEVSMRRPTRAAIRSMTRMMCSASRKRTSVFSRRPNRSTYTWSGALTRMSLTAGSASSGASGPIPIVSSVSSSARRSRSTSLRAMFSDAMARSAKSLTAAATSAPSLSSRPRWPISSSSRSWSAAFTVR